MGVNIINADAVQWARNYSGELFHAMLCDPPYHLTSIVKRFGGSNAAPAQHGTDGAFARASRGFMGKQWDGGDVAFNPETWYEFSKVLYPGAFGMAFASSRGWHRLAVAIEDAGFIIHPSLFGWAYGSGFPKATRVKGDEVFKGHRYGLQALKPALEPIIVFQKPYEGRPIENITQYGAGALNIDGGRIGTEERPVMMRTETIVAANSMSGQSTGATFSGEFTTQGRWPSNLILLDDEAAAALDRQSGVSESKRSMRGDLVDNRGDNYNRANGKRIEDSNYERGFNDAGGASRFFFRVQDAIDSADPVYYEAKASTEERNAGLDNITPKELGHNRFDKCANCGGYMFQNPDRPSACKCKNPVRQNNSQVNPHPTVKPIALARYLATLLLPPTEYAPRRLFIPFAGVASECIGSMQAGWDEITGVELTEEYIPIAQARIEYWRARGWQLSMFSETLTQENANV